MTDRLMLRPAEAADAIGISRTKAYELISRGEIPSVKVGGCVRVPVLQLKAWIEKQVAEQSRS